MKCLNALHRQEISEILARIGRISSLNSKIIVNVLPLTSHMDMRGTHTSTVNPHHSLHFMQNPTQTRRNIHLTPAQHYHTLHNNLPPVLGDSSVRTDIHTEFTQRALDSLPPNSLLSVRPPAACETELTLDRWQRVQLGRLRCSCTTLVPSYMHTLGLAQDDSCPNYCGSGPVDTEHVLLHCPHIQQHRITHDIHSLKHLWTSPVEVSNFLLDSGMVQRPT